MTFHTTTTLCIMLITRMNANKLFVIILRAFLNPPILGVNDEPLKERANIITKAPKSYSNAQILPDLKAKMLFDYMGSR